MSELGAIFGGGAEHAHNQLESEKILPAPAPIAGAPLRDDEGLDIVIPPLDAGSGVLPDPPRVKRED